MKPQTRILISTTIFAFSLLFGLFLKPGATGFASSPAGQEEIRNVPGSEAPGDCVLRLPDIPGSTDADRIPLVDMAGDPSLNYFGYTGGLYPDSTNLMPLAHAQAGFARAQAVRPLDVNGLPAEDGRIVFLSVGMSNSSQEFCGSNIPCLRNSFAGQAIDDPEVSDRIAFYNGAQNHLSAEFWLDPTEIGYQDIESGLEEQGLSVEQVQIIWLKVANTMEATRPSLPDPDADVVLLLANLGQIVRNLDDLYPNLQQVFVSSRTYGGYAENLVSPEPWAYETGFGFKWLIEAQIHQMEYGEIDACAGDLDYNGEAPWIGWSAYLWANGMEPRSDGLYWERSDFVDDGMHPSKSGVLKVGGLLLDFFKHSPLTSGWFLAAGQSVTPTPTPSGTVPAPTPMPTGTRPSPTPTASPASDLMFHVGNLDGESSAAGGSLWDAAVLVYVEDSDGNPMAYAVVSGTWNNGDRGDNSCTTDAAGWCAVIRTDLRGASAAFTVTFVSVPGYTYTQVANHDPDGDSDGTTIILESP